MVKTSFNNVIKLKTKQIIKKNYRMTKTKKSGIPT
jgi:hypothetical protein